MAIYSILLEENLNNALSFENINFFEYEYFDNEEQILLYKTNKENEKKKVINMKKIENLGKTLQNIQFKDWFELDVFNDSIFYFNIFVDKFGFENLKNQFPIEMSDVNFLISEIQRINNYKYEEMEKKRLEEDKQLQNNFFNNIDLPEITASLDEMKGWDDEDPMWRFANDVV